MHVNSGERLRPQRRRRTAKMASAVECSACGLYGLCRVAGLDASPPSLLDEVVKRCEKVSAGQRLVTAGHPLSEIIAIRSGSFKSTANLAGGEELVVDFFLAGELMGLDALIGGPYPHNLEAMEESSICRFRLSRRHLLEQHMGEFQQQLILALARQARRDCWVPLLMGAKSAEQRLALFLLGLSSRLVEHGLPGRRFRLPMSRQLIANYLGLAMETVSRILKRFHAQGLVAVQARNIELIDMAGLGAVAGIAPDGRL